MFQPLDPNLDFIRGKVAISQNDFVGMSAFDNGMVFDSIDTDVLLMDFLHEILREIDISEIRYNVQAGRIPTKGRTLAQGALAWLWGRSEKTIPIPGFKTIQQVEENAAAMQFGPLNSDQMREIDSILWR